MLHLRADGPVVHLTLQHGRANALDLELCEALAWELGKLAESDARAVVLSGQGPIFCAGVDLLRLLEGGQEYIAGFLRALRELCEALLAFEKPLVAAVGGHAIAGGCVVACAGDRRPMARGTGRVGVPELHVGVPFPPAALELVRLVVPRHRFHDVVFGGATYEPEAALALHLVDELVEPESLEARATELARGYAALVPSAFALTKRAARADALERARESERRFGDDVLAAWTSRATLTAIEAYVERTLRKRR